MDPPIQQPVAAQSPQGLSYTAAWCSILCPPPVPLQSFPIWTTSTTHLKCSYWCDTISNFFAFHVILLSQIRVSQVCIGMWGHACNCVCVWFWLVKKDHYHLTEGWHWLESKPFDTDTYGCSAGCSAGKKPSLTSWTGTLSNIMNITRLGNSWLRSACFHEVDLEYPVQGLCDSYCK